MAHSAAVTKAVIPVAGLGTRFLPATKATPKVMMPVVDKPAIQYVVEEAAAAGLQDVLLVTGDGQESIADHFSRARELERQLEAKGNVKALAAVRAPTELADVSYARHHQPRGLGHAVACAADHVGNEPFAVLLGDDLISADEALLDKMIGVRKLHGGSVVALMRETPPGRGGEIQLTDALRTLAVADRDACADGGVHGVLFRGRRFDTGNKQDFLRTTVEFACARPDLAGDFVPWLREYVSTLT